MRSALTAASTTSRSTAPRLAGALLRTQPDTRLARLAGEGSEAAFEEIVRRYRAELVSFAGKIAARDAADDVVQESMVKAHAALLRGDRPDSPRAWLYAIVRNTALNHRRDHRRHEALDESHDGVEQPPEAADRRRLLRDLVAAMRRLPRAQREALVQRELAGKGHEEIADELEISPGAVRQLIFRARAALRAGVGALVPMQLLRAAVLGGATEQGASVATTGAGVAAKLGVGAVITTGALFAGTGAVEHGSEKPSSTSGAPQAVAAGTERKATGGTTESVASKRPDRRNTVIVTPKASRPRTTTAAPPRGVAAPPRTERSPVGDQSYAPPPSSGSQGADWTSGSYPTSGAGGVGGAGGDDLSTVQHYSAQSTRECEGDGGSDPAPGGVSPG